MILNSAVHWAYILDTNEFFANRPQIEILSISIMATLKGCSLSSVRNMVTGEAIEHLLDIKEVCVSASFACNQIMDEPSHIVWKAVMRK